LPFILDILKDDIEKEVKQLDFTKIEKKLLKIYNEDIIPEEIKNKIDFNN
jgi:hypothetical protein